MPYNGSGTFNRDYNWVTDDGNGINIEATRMDDEDDGFATGLSTCITKDGQTTITSNIPFNSKKITGLANGSARTDSIALGQVQDGTYGTLGTAGGSADVYTASPSPAITAYATGSRYILSINADTTGSSTLNVSAVGAKAIKKYNGAGAKVDTIAGDLQASQYYDLFYDGTDFVVFNPETVELLKGVTGEIDDLTVNDKFNLQASSTAISAGAIAYANGYMEIGPESGTADDLDTITGGVKGDILIIRSSSSSNTITILHSGGNILTSTTESIVLDSSADKVMFINQDGTNWAQVASSTQLDFKSSQAANGYTYLPNGLIMQWGDDTATTGGFAATFPLTFPTAFLNGSATAATAVSNTNSQRLHISSPSTSGMTITNPRADGLVYWIAIGH